MEKVTLAAALSVMFFLTAPAQADVIYTFNPAFATHSDPDRISPVNGVSFQLVLKDSAVRGGSFQLSGSGSGDFAYDFTGDLGGFVRMDVFETPISQYATSSYDYVTPTHVYGVFSINLSFSPQENISSGSMFFGGLGAEFNLNISANFVSGTWGSDSDNCSGCFEYGALTITRVPEPATSLLLPLGLAALSLSRRRQAFASIGQ